MAKPCAGRHHTWNAAGTACTKCGAPKGKAGRPPGAKTKVKAGEMVAARLAATLGTAAPPASSEGKPRDVVQEATSSAVAPLGTAAPSPAPSVASGAPAAAPPSKSAEPDPFPEAKGWCKSAGKRLTQVFIAATVAAIDALGREPNEPDEDDEEAFAEAMGSQLAIWFPDSALTPAKQLMLSGSFIAGSMWIGAKKKPKPPPRMEGASDKNGTAGAASTVTAARAVSSTSEETRPPS